MAPELATLAIVLVTLALSGIPALVVVFVAAEIGGKR
jgi:hypothetical protein